jgi:hypothetical protein
MHPAGDGDAIEIVGGTNGNGATAALTGMAALALVALTLASAFVLAFAAAVVLAAVWFCNVPASAPLSEVVVIVRQS